MELLSSFLQIILLNLIHPYFSVPFTIIVVLLYIFKTPVFLSRWHHTFDFVPISPNDFFKAIEDDLAKKGIEGTDYDRITHQQTFLFGAYREYLRVKRKHHCFDVCAAHVGAGCYVSWWFFERESLLRRVVLRIPLLRWFLSQKTLHQIDEEDAFQDMVHHSVLEAVDAMTGIKGSTLSEAERSIISIKNLTQR